jgi:hypothetical protein
VVDLRRDGTVTGVRTFMGVDSKVDGLWKFDPSTVELTLEMKAATAVARALIGSPRYRISIIGREGKTLKGRQISALLLFSLTKLD